MRGITIPFASILVTIFILIMIFAPIFVTRIHIERIIRQDLSFNRARNTLLTLLLLTHIDSLDSRLKPISEIIAENITLTPGPDLEFLRSILDFYIPSKCFRLFYEKDGMKILLIEARTTGCKFNQTAIATIALSPGANGESFPTQNITLVVD